MKPSPGPGNEQYPGHPPHRTSPLEPLDTIFNESEEFSQRYMEGNVPPYPQSGSQTANINGNPAQEYSQRHAQDPEGAGFRYPSESSLRPERPQDPPPASAGAPPRHWPPHMESQPGRGPPVGAGYPPRHGAASGMHQQEAWYGSAGRDASSSTTTSQASPVRRMLPQQYDNQYGAGGPPGLPPQPPRTSLSGHRGPPNPPGPMEGYPYSPQPGYGAYPPQYYPPQRLYPDSFSPDPRHAYHGGYGHPYPGYYEHQQRFMGGLNPLDAPYRNEYMGHPGYGGAMPPQMPHPFAAPVHYIKEVNENDVLCGRGGATNSHAGNRSYRELVKSFKDKYLKAKKKQKPNVAAEVVAKIRSLDPPGRFLKKDKESGWYVDIGDARAKEKTSQALREGAPLIRKQMFEGKKEGGTSSDDGASPEKPPAEVPTQSEQEKEDRKIPSGGTASAFSSHQASVAIDSNEGNPPDNRGEPAVKKEVSKITDADEEKSRKRTSPVDFEDDKESSGESPMKRQMTGEGPVKREDPFRDVFEPPRASSIRKDDEKEGGKEEEKDESGSSIRGHSEDAKQEDKEKAEENVNEEKTEEVVNI